MPTPGQLTFDLGHRPALDMEDFLVAASNSAAVAWLDGWPDWPGPSLALAGPSGSGKTHLAHVFARRSGGMILRASDSCMGDDLHSLDQAPAVIVENGDSVELGEAFLHLYNWTAETGRHLLLTGRTPPSHWTTNLADLRSRLSAIPVGVLQPPGDDLLGAVLIKTLGDRQLAVGQDVVRYVVPRIERSFAAVHAFVTVADGRSLAERRGITIPLAREVLSELEVSEEAE